MSFFATNVHSNKNLCISVQSLLFGNRILLSKSEKKKNQVSLYLNYFINKPVVPRQQQLEHSK